MVSSSGETEEETQKRYAHPHGTKQQVKFRSTSQVHGCDFLDPLFGAQNIENLM